MLGGLLSVGITLSTHKNALNLKGVTGAIGGAVGGAIGLELGVAAVIAGATFIGLSATALPVLAAAGWLAHWRADSAATFSKARQSR